LAHIALTFLRQFKMPALDAKIEEASALKREVSAKLAFLGISCRDAAALNNLWTFVNVSLVTQSQPQKLVKAISKELSHILGVPRAESFVKWLAEKVHAHLKVVNDVDRDAKKLETDKISASMGLASTLVRPDICSTVDASKEMLVEGKSNESGGAKEGLQTCSSGDALNEAWVEVKSKGGKIYYWDRLTNSCAWALPHGVIAKYRSNKAPNGRSYYYDRKGNSFWVLPALPSSREATGKASIVPGRVSDDIAKRSQPPVVPILKETKDTADKMDVEVEPASVQPIEHQIFLPELGVLKPVALPDVLPASSDDLGPFEAVLAPETPVLPGLSSGSIRDEKKDSMDQDCDQDSLKKKLQIKLLTFKLEAMSQHSAGLLDEVQCLRKELADAKENSMTPSMRTEPQAFQPRSPDRSTDFATEDRREKNIMRDSCRDRSRSPRRAMEENASCFEKSMPAASCVRAAEKLRSKYKSSDIPLDVKRSGRPCIGGA
jgi:hypothetical protein